MTQWLRALPGALPVAFAAGLALAGGNALADTAGTAQIYLQRQPDGGAVLTDHPSANALTERVWRMEREDPKAARERAAEVQREADAVSLRVQRSIESQQRLASEAYALRLMARQHQDLADDDSIVGGVVVPLAYGGRGWHRHRHQVGGHHPGYPGRHPHWPLRGSASPASR